MRNYVLGKLILLYAPAAIEWLLDKLEERSANKALSHAEVRRINDIQRRAGRGTNAPTIKLPRTPSRYDD